MTQEACFTFTTPLNVNIVEIKGVEHTFVEGDISTNDIDFVNDIMSKKCQESMQKQILERNMKLDIEHESFKGETSEEKEINKTKIPAGKLIDAVVKSLGKGRYSTRVKGEINRNRADYKAIQGNLVEKYLDAFSVAFLPTDVKYIEKDGKQIRILDDCILLNVALTGNPCNTKAQIAQVVTKSMDALENYKKRKEVDPSIEDVLVVKNKDIKKENPLSFVWNKIYSGQLLTKAEQNLLKAAMVVANNTGLQAQLIKELFDKIVSGVKLSYKDYYIFRELIEVDSQINDSPVMAVDSTYKSKSSNKTGDNSEINLPKNSKKMTDDKDPNEDVDPTAVAADAGTEDAGKSSAAADAGEGTDADKGDATESGDVESKAALVAISADMKAITEKYDVMKKENDGIKADVKAIAESVAKITEALGNPIHKSKGVHLTDAAQAASTEGKSVDPLSLF